VRGGTSATGSSEKGSGYHTWAPADSAAGPVRPEGQRIQVDDRKYGRIFEAYFERRSRLLLAIHETLTAVEALWFQQKHNRRAPT